MARTIRGPQASADGGGAAPVPGVSDTLVDLPRGPGDLRPASPSCEPGRESAVGPADRALLGAVVGGKYQIVRQLAVGGMGTVFEARHTALARRFAVKVLSLESEKQADAVQRFKREAELASAIGHENIIDVVDIDRTGDGRWYIVMELLEGEELRERIFRLGRLPIEEVLSISRQLGAALDAAHSRGVVHRDLKPENIFLLARDEGGLTVKVLDFGISKVRDAELGLTRPGEVLGTPYYMAPEQARGDRTIDHRADLFAFGAVVYEALTGAAPFEGETPNAVLRSILIDDPRPPSELVADLPPRVSRVVLKALSKDPLDRYQSGGQLATALARAVECAESAPELEPPSSPSTLGAVADPAAPRRGGYGPAHLAAAFGLGLALGAAALALVKLLG